MNPPAGNRRSAKDAVLAPLALDASVQLAAREKLNRLGCIRHPPGQLPPIAWSVGIPSLMRHASGSGRPFAKRPEPREKRRLRHAMGACGLSPKASQPKGEHRLNGELRPAR